MTSYFDLETTLLNESSDEESSKKKRKKEDKVVSAKFDSLYNIGNFIQT